MNSAGCVRSVKNKVELVNYRCVWATRRCHIVLWYVAILTACARDRVRFGMEAGRGAMLVACRLADLSALEAHYADVIALTQIGRCHQRRDPTS